MRALAPIRRVVAGAAALLLAACAGDPLAGDPPGTDAGEGTTRASLSRWAAQVDGAVDPAYAPFALRTYVVARSADVRLEALMAEVLDLGAAPRGTDLAEYNVFILPVAPAFAADFEAMAADSRDELAAATGAWYDFGSADRLADSICARPSATLPPQLEVPCAIGFREGPYLLTFHHAPDRARALPDQFLMKDLSDFKMRSFPQVVHTYLVAVARDDGTAPLPLGAELRLAMIDLTGRASDAFPELLAQAAKIWSAAWGGTSAS